MQKHRETKTGFFFEIFMESISALAKWSIINFDLENFGFSFLETYSFVSYE